MARFYNGTSDKIVATVYSGITTGNPWTLASWVNIPTLGTNGLSLYNGNDGANGFGILASYNGNSNRVTVLLGGIGFLNGTTALTVNTWAHVAAKYDNNVGGGTITIYLNGSSIGSAGSQAWNAPGTSFQIGNVNFGGSQADGALWTAVLTVDEIKALTNGARPGQIRPASLKTWWPLTGVQSPEPDLGGTANNGTLTGTTNASGPPVMMFTPRWPQTTPTGAGASSVVFRRSLSPLGTRTGSRQAIIT